MTISHTDYSGFPESAKQRKGKLRYDLLPNKEELSAAMSGAYGGPAGRALQELCHDLRLNSGYNVSVNTAEIRRELARVLTFGAMKYQEGSWRTVPAMLWYQAHCRHMEAIRLHDSVDHEYGVLHSAYALWNAIAYAIASAAESVAPAKVEPAVIETSD